MTDLGSDLDFAYAVTVQADGKIVVAGSSHNTTTGGDFAVARYSTSGTLDTSFQITGITKIDLGGSAEAARAVAVQPADGKIVTAGYSNASGAPNFALTRSNFNDGSLDTGFSNGTIVTNLNGNDIARAMAIQSDGMLVTAGSTDSNGTDDFAIVRYKTSGARDNGFNGNGVAKTDFSSGSDLAYAVAVDTSGRIVVAGVSAGHVALARYSSTGSLDLNFGDPTGTGQGSGKVTTPWGTASQINALAIQPDGKIVVAGYDDDAINGKNILIVCEAQAKRSNLSKSFWWSSNHEPSQATAG